MSGPPRLPLHVGDYLKDTPPISRVNWEHHGIYLLALMIAWSTPQCRLPNDPQWLARRFGCTVDDYHELVEPVLLEYFDNSGNWLRQKRLAEEHENVRDFSKKQSDRRKSKKTNEKTPNRKANPVKPESSSGSTRGRGTVSVSESVSNNTRSENSESLPPHEDASATAPSTTGKKYAFEGKVIRLNQADYDRWARAYDKLSSLDATLTSYDDFLDGQPDNERSRWFVRTSAYLAKKNDEAADRAQRGNHNGKTVPALPWMRMPEVPWDADENTRRNRLRADLRRAGIDPDATPGAKDNEKNAENSGETAEGTS